MNQQIEQYVKAGWKVFPCLPNSKQPAVKWTQYIAGDYNNDRLTELNAYHERGYNLAVALKPSNLVAFDLDSYRGDGAKLPSDILSTSLIQNTPRGGKHYIFTPNGNGDKLSDIKLSDYNIDVKYNGYVLITPSAVEYDTQEGGKWIGSYSWDKWGEATHLPESVVQRFFVGQQTAAPTPTLSMLDQISASVNPQEIVTGVDPLDVLTNVISRGRFDEGQHNQQLLELSRALYRVMQSDNDELKAQTVAKVMLALDAKDPTPQGEYQALETIKSGISYEHQRLAPKIAKRASNAISVPSNGGLAIGKPKRFGVSTFAQVAYDYENYTVDYIIDGVIPRQGIIMMSAPPETFKTWLGFDVVTSISLNRPFLGKFMPQLNDKRMRRGYGEPTLIVQQEDFEGLQVQRLNTILAGKWGASNYRMERVSELTYVIETPDLAPIFMHTDRGLSLENPDSVQGLADVISEHKISYTYIDPFYSLMASTESYFSDAGNKLQLLRDVRSHTDSGFLIAHHSKKSDGGKRGRDNVWGSQFLLGAVEGILVVSPVSDKQVELELTGKFYEKPIRGMVTFDITTDPNPELARYSATVEDLKETPSGNKGLILEFLQVNSDKFSVTEVAEELELNKGTVSKALKSLTDEGLAVKIGTKYVANDHLTLGF